MSEVIGEFRGRYRFLSNFWMADQVVGGITFCCNEQWYVYSKCRCSPKQFRARILATRSPRAVKKLGRTANCILPDGWGAERVEVMREGVRAKFTQNLELKGRLLDTGGVLLQEGNTWGDDFWGVDLDTGIGHNVLGELLMEQRDELVADGG